MLKVVLDTNIFISALIFNGKPEEIFLSALQGNIQLFTSIEILQELKEVLKIKFRWSEEKTKLILDIIISNATIVYPKEKVTLIKMEADNRILECALESKVDYIVTGDKKHILPLGNFQDIKIVDPASFISLYKALQNT